MCQICTALDRSNQIQTHHNSVAVLSEPHPAILNSQQGHIQLSIHIGKRSFSAKQSVYTDNRNTLEFFGLSRKGTFLCSVSCFLTFLPGKQNLSKFHTNRQKCRLFCLKINSKQQPLIDPSVSFC